MIKQTQPLHDTVHPRQNKIYKNLITPAGFCLDFITIC